jgi:hypothetical protein
MSLSSFIVGLALLSPSDVAIQPVISPEVANHRIAQREMPRVNYGHADDGVRYPYPVQEQMADPTNPFLFPIPNQNEHQQSSNEHQFPSPQGSVMHECYHQSDTELEPTEKGKQEVYREGKQKPYSEDSQ